jgi:hypothetical protein
MFFILLYWRFIQNRKLISLFLGCMTFFVVGIKAVEKIHEFSPKKPKKREFSPKKSKKEKIREFSLQKNISTKLIREPKLGDEWGILKYKKAQEFSCAYDKKYVFCPITLLT